MGYAVGTGVATALKVVQRHCPFLANPKGKAGQVVFSNEKPPPQWQECNAHWSAPYYTIHYTSLEIEESTEHSAFTILLLAEAEVTLAFDWKDRNQK